MVWYTTVGMVYAMIGYGMGLVWYPFFSSGFSMSIKFSKKSVSKNSKMAAMKGMKKGMVHKYVKCTIKRSKNLAYKL